MNNEKKLDLILKLNKVLEGTVHEDCFSVLVDLVALRILIMRATSSGAKDEKIKIFTNGLKKDIEKGIEAALNAPLERFNE
jgi:uncharacterized protein YihD (DUF1040 family)